MRKGLSVIIVSPGSMMMVARRPIPCLSILDWLTRHLAIGLIGSGIVDPRKAMSSLVDNSGLLGWLELVAFLFELPVASSESAFRLFRCN